MTAFHFYIVLFWLSFTLLFYTYLGYGMLLYVWVKISLKKKPAATPGTPALTLVVAAFDEEDCIEEKISNSLQLDYPGDQLHFLFVTDGSTDRTPEIVGRFPKITLLHQQRRQGKAAALNRAMADVRTEFVVFTDANTLLNRECLRKIVAHYTDPEVGGVAGEKKIRHHRQHSPAVESGEGLYWQYESFLKNLDAQFHTVVGAAGELFSIRTGLYRPLEEQTITDDFMISMQVCLQGYRVEYEPEAFALEAASASMKEESKRKVRISAGSFQAMARLRKLLRPGRYPKLYFQYLSRRVFRWALCPFLLVVFFFSNLWLYLFTESLLYHISFYAQAVFYLMAAVGGLLANSNSRVPVFYIPYYFVFMNACTFLGFLRYARGKQSAMWEKVLRKKLA